MVKIGAAGTSISRYEPSGLKCGQSPVNAERREVHIDLLGEEDVGHNQS